MGEDGFGTIIIAGVSLAVLGGATYAYLKSTEVLRSIPKQSSGYINILQSGEVVPYSARIKAAQTTNIPREFKTSCGMPQVICF